MSFHGDNQRRYGHVPPVQYPVANRSNDQPSYSARRPSFDQGDDAALFASAQAPSPGYHNAPPLSRAPAGGDELFLSSAGGTAQTESNVSSQNQYESPYSPQYFSQAPSTSLPYHTGPPSQYPTSATAPPSQQVTAATSSYTPAAYNPAAYASTTVPQRTPTYQGYNNYSPHYGASQSTGGYGSPNSAYPPALPHVPQASTPSIPQYDPALPSPPPHSATSPQASTYDPSVYSTTSYRSSQYSTFSNGTSPAVTSYSASSSATTPYPTYSQIPVGPNYSANDTSLSYYNRASRSNSQASRLSSPQTPATSMLQRHPTNAPLPGPPVRTPGEERPWGSNGTIREDDFSEERRAQETIMQDIEAELSGRRPRPAPIDGVQLSDDDIRNLRGSNASTPTTDGARISSAGGSARHHARYPSRLGEESDPEGTAGVWAMQQAEMDDRRFGGNPYPKSDVMPMPTMDHLDDDDSSGSDFGGMDLGLFSGGYAGNLTYGTDVGSPPIPGPNQDDARQLPPTPSHNMYGTRPAVSADDDRKAPAEMDYPGAGGLQPATSNANAYRSSFDDGEERRSEYSRHSGSESPYKEDYPDIFYHPGLSNRPLPALPMLDTQSGQSTTSSSHGQPYQHNYSQSSDPHLAYPQDRVDVYTRPSSTQSPVERSISMISHSTTPVVQTPARSRTDAAEERRRIHRQAVHNSGQLSTRYEYDSGTPSSVAYDMITLPTGRKRKFIPSKLTSHDIRLCVEPWALSGIAAWVRLMADGEPDLKTKTIEEGLVRMFTAKVPIMNVADAETLGARVVGLMLESGILVREEEWVKFGTGSISGVLWQLTGSGCYGPKLHEMDEPPGRCYSYHCTRTLRKANVDNLLSEQLPEHKDWATFYGVTKEDMEGRPKKLVQRQNNLHEVVTTEQEFMGQLEVLRKLYRDNLRTMQPSIVPPQKLEKFLKNVFGKVDIVLEANRDHLLSQLKYRQQEQGPWISGFSDLFREWIRKARIVFIEYASSFPLASFMIRREAERNILFRKFLDQARNEPLSKRLDWTTFLKAPITRLQRYPILLSTVEKNTEDNDEKSNLAKAIAEIHAVALECDQKVAEMQKKVEMMELNSMLVLRPGFQAMLNLDHLGRELLFQGDLQRTSTKGMRYVESHALLFDHYLIIAKTVNKDGRGEKKFDVSKEPIPMPLLFLDSTEDAVIRQKSITAPLGRTATSVSDTRLTKVTTNGSDRPGLEHIHSSSSAASAPRLGSQLPTDSEGKLLYPFRVKHLGHDTYTLFASTPLARQEWCTKIIEAKTRHAQALFTQNAEPFRLRVLADSAFAYDSISAIGKQPSIKIEGTPLDRALRDLETVYGPGRGPPPVSRAQINCSTGFTAYGKSVIAIGTDYGVFISDASDPRGWQRTVSAQKVTQIAVLEEFSVCLIIADRSLISYPLDVVAPISNFPAPAHDSSRRAPQRLAKDVSFFAAARMKERMLVFYKRKEGVHNTFFKVLEPVLHRSTEKKSRLFGGRKGLGSTDSFRDYDEFFFPTDCYSLNLFQSYIAVSTSKGFELLTLDKKQPMSIPDVKQPAIANIASRIRDQKPLGMFRLNDQEFLLTYEDCAVYVDKHGDVSRTLIMEYSGKQKKAKGATLCGQYLILFNDDYVEVRNAENGRLRQIIAGRDVRCLDYGARGPTGTTAVQGGPTVPIQSASGLVDSRATVKIGMTHPEIPGMQVVLEMLLNDGHREK